MPVERLESRGIARKNAVPDMSKPSITGLGSFVRGVGEVMDNAGELSRQVKTAQRGKGVSACAHIGDEWSGRDHIQRVTHDIGDDQNICRGGDSGEAAAFHELAVLANGVELLDGAAALADERVQAIEIIAQQAIHRADEIRGCSAGEKDQKRPF